MNALALLVVVCLGTPPLSAQDEGGRVPAPVVSWSSTETVPAGTALRLYEARHLTGHARLAELVAAVKDTSSASGVEDALERLENLEHLRTDAERTAASLVAAVREQIDPQLEGRVQRIDHLGLGSLVLVGSPEQHAWLARFLEAASEFDGLIDIQARIYSLPPGQLSKLSRGRSGEVLGGEGVANLLRELERAGVEAVTTPRVATFPFQEASLSVIQQQAYIRDYELKVLPDLDAEVADPVIDVVDSGILMNLRGVPLADGLLGVAVELEYSDLEEPIPTAEIVLGAGKHKVTVQLPQVTKVSLEGSFELAPGETLMLATTDPTGEKEILVLLKATRVEAQRSAPGEGR